MTEVPAPIPGHVLQDGEPEPWGWFLATHRMTGERHGVPTWDLREHELHVGCWCHPQLDEWGVLAHNSADGRERYELGLAKRH